MHPAPSVIIFTALSGLGFGLLTWLGFGYPQLSGVPAFAMFFVAFALATGGLLASTFHLGNPQRALKAFSQWRSSWLSREAILAVASLATMGLYAIGLIFLNSAWPLLGAAGGALSLATVFSTSMIYAQMKTVPRWRMPLTPVLFLAYALGGGALLAGQVAAASLLLLASSALQLIGWKLGDQRFAEAGSTIETATGLGFLGRVRLLEKPHSGSNYLMREMVHVVGRKHALKLRGIALLTLGVLPAMLLLLLPFNHFIAAAAVASHLIGLLAVRWLFFAEAEHVVGLYYNQRRAG
jgi:sulfite dehydrogenase (quinone) subunit SoeC